MTMTQLLPDEHPFNDASRHHHGSIRSQILRNTLDSARKGTLKTSWRDDLQPPIDSIPAQPIYTDPDHLVVEEIRQMPPAAWEPGNSSNWRDAVDAWYLAYRAVLIDQAVTNQQNLSRMLQSRTTALNSRYQSIMRRFATPTVSLAEEVRGTLGDFDRYIDLSRRQFDDLYIAQRDRLGASYLAGRAAGGDDTGWTDWFEARMAKWNNSQAAEVARAQIASPDFRAEFERLPAYWAGE
jgi:hypothetical protein